MINLGTFYGFWTCEYCGRENSGKDRNCRGCGHPRDNNTKFYPAMHGDSARPREYIKDYVDLGPDWSCSYCGALNPATVKICKGCSHNREESDKHYFELHPERVEIRKNLSDFEKDLEGDNNVDDNSNNSDGAAAKIDVGNGAANGANGGVANVADAGTFGNDISDDNVRIGLDFGDSRVLKFLLIAVTALLLVVGLVFLLKPKTAEITVVDKMWERSVTVEEYRTLHEEDWSIPIGGRMTGSHQEIHHYDSVLDHYETVTRTRRVQSGGHYEVTGYRDNGNGTFTEITSYVPDYTTETYTEQEPVYTSVPVYQTKYQYDIERWQFDHFETTSGHDDEPYFATVETTARYRPNGTSENYRILATYVEKNEGVSKEFTVDYQKWQEISIGDSYVVKIHLGGLLEFMDE